MQHDGEKDYSEVRRVLIQVSQDLRNLADVHSGEDNLCEKLHLLARSAEMLRDELEHHENDNEDTLELA